MTIRIIISIVLIIILLYTMRGKYDQVLAALANTHLLLFCAALVIFIAGITVASIRLGMIVRAQGTVLTLFEALSLTFIGYFFNNFLPTAIGGDVAKAYYLSHKTDHKVGSYTSVFVDRAIGLCTMVGMAFVALLIAGNMIVDTAVRNLIYAITALSAIFIVFMMSKNVARLFSVLFVILRPFERQLKALYNAIHCYKDQKILMLKSLALSVISQLFFFLSLGTLAASINAHIPLMQLFLRVPIISALSLLPSINGLGVREGSTVVLFKPLIGPENAFAVSMLWLVVLLIVSVIGGTIYALSPQFRIKLSALKAEEPA